MLGCRKFESSYGILEYLCRWNKIGLLDSKLFADISTGETDRKVIRVRVGSCRVGTRSQGCFVPLKHWKNEHFRRICRKVTYLSSSQSFLGASSAGSCVRDGYVRRNEKD